MFEKKEEIEKLGIKPGNVFRSIMELIGAIITIILSIIYLTVIQIILSTMALALIISLAYLFTMFRHLQKMKKDYNKLIKDYNNLFDTYEFANDNRESLQALIESKDKKIDHLQFINMKNQSVISVLWFFYMRPLIERPTEEDLEQAMQIEHDKEI